MSFGTIDDNKYLHVYKGKCFNKTYVKKYQKIIVFDLDETIGSFSDLYILWSGLKNILDFSSENEQDRFNEILDLYPEFLRYGILNILDYLYLKKKEGDCDKIYIYTNNICNQPWVSLITSYFKYRLKLTEDVFDKTISAFKINNKIVEISRTTKDKTWSELINCTMIPKTTEICFLDNTYYKEMLNEKVYYIKPLGYHHKLITKTIIDRFLSSAVLKKLMKNTNHNMNDYLEDWFELHGKTGEQTVRKNYEIDVFVAQKMMYHVKEFFHLTNRANKTKKNKLKLGRTTRKYIKK